MNQTSQKTEKNYIKVGQIKEPFGLKGHVRVFLYSQDYSWFNQLKEFFLQAENEEFVSHRILTQRAEAKGVVVLLETVSTRNQSDLLSGRNIFLPKDFFVSRDHEKPFLIELIDFDVIDEVFGHIGKIKSFSTNGPQDILLVSPSLECIKKFLIDQDSLLQIPFVDEFVKRIVREEKKMFTLLPEGLLEINNL